MLYMTEHMLGLGLDKTYARAVHWSSSPVGMTAVATYQNNFDHSPQVCAVGMHAS